MSNGYPENVRVQIEMVNIRKPTINSVAFRSPKKITAIEKRDSIEFIDENAYHHHYSGGRERSIGKLESSSGAYI